MKNISLLFMAILMISANLSYAQFYSDSFEFEGDIRNYDVYLPQNFQSDMPVVLNLHGYNWSTAEHAAYSLMNDYADTSGFIVVYPAGSFAPSNGVVGWNNGLRNHPFGRTDITSNDVGFISALIDTLKSNYNIDMSRIYSCGFSMGGEMTYRLAIELGHRFAAIASVSGKINDVSGNIGIPMRPMSVMHFHGTLDNIELYGPGGGNLWSAEETVNFWIQNNNCVLTPDTIAIPDTCISDSCTVQRISHSNCADSTQVIFYKIIQGGHTWPGADSSIWSGGGFLNRDVNASMEIVNFFKNYNNPLVNIAWTKNADITHSGYIPSQQDTLFIKTYTENPQNNSIIVKAKILGASTAYTDSLILYDDGMHGDENPNDNIWGNSKVLSGIPEDKYFVDIYTHDLIEGTSQKYRKLNYFFLRKGPVVLDHYRITSSDTIPHNTDKLKFEFTLRNEGLSAAASNITSEVVALDTFSIISGLVKINYGDIQAGTTAVGPEKQYLKFDLGNDLSVDSINVRFKIDISSSGYLFWSDTFSVFVFRDPSEIELLDQNTPKEFSLKQNYPNPFNPATNIEFSLPKSEFVTLKIFNLLGQEVTTLVSEKLKSGTYQYTWNAGSLASGVYMYHLQTENYTETRKMVLMR